MQFDRAALWSFDKLIRQLLIFLIDSGKYAGICNVLIRFQCPILTDWGCICAGENAQAYSDGIC